MKVFYNNTMSITEGVIRLEDNILIAMEQFGFYENEIKEVINSIIKEHELGKNLKLCMREVDIMNIMLNMLDNFKLVGKSYSFIPDKVKLELNMDGKILGIGSEFLVSGKDIMTLVRKSNLREQIGINEYNALMRKPMVVFLMASTEADFGKTKEELDKMYGMISIKFNNFVQAFSIACWFIKDSCIDSTNMYWCNLLNKYKFQSKRYMHITLSTGEIKEISLDDIEMQEAIRLTYEVLIYLLPNESNMSKISCNVINGTVNWEVDKAISTEGKSFARALIILQEARRTGYLATKIDKYCSMLECLYAIKENHKKNIKNITAAYISDCKEEREQIRIDMQDAYSVRSDGSHGDSLKYLKRDGNDLKELAHKLDQYSRKVFRNVLKEPRLNYGVSSEEKVKTRAYFMEKAKEIYPDDYEKK